ncbi:MAG: hypothetical protein LWW95_03220 [Candidatus Desulfofervidus auxilii]|nr:hypothetical protein [Candidatus Desulfofervidus auxilii]
MSNLQSFQQALQNAQTFIFQQNNPPYFIYFNFTNKYCAIHSSSSPNLPQNRPGQCTKFECTDNGFWYGPFNTYSEALAFCIIMSDFHHIDYGEYVSVSNGSGINYVPKRPR